MSEPVTIPVRLKVNNITPYWRGEYRRYRGQGFMPRDVALIIWGRLKQHQIEAYALKVFDGESSLGVDQRCSA